MTKKLKPVLFLIAVIFMFSGCKDDDNPSSPNCDENVIISESQYNSATSDIFTINSATIEGDCLIVNYSASGCNGESWEMRLIDSAGVAESLPPQRYLRLVFTNNEGCLAFITAEISFDLSDLKVEGDALILNISNLNESLTYNY